MTKGQSHLPVPHQRQTFDRAEWGDGHEVQSGAHPQPNLTGTQTRRHPLTGGSLE
jgi:hypothetical protein